MTRFFQKLTCRLFGHSTVQVPQIFFLSWDGVREIGSLRCKRCGVMLDEYRRNMAERI